MPICIGGMHRSGTSMVARLLNLAGLYLGRDEDLKGPSRFNLDGFWEHRRFMDLNEEILNQLGGGWDCPPPMPPGWTESESIRRLGARAESLVAEFAGRDPWGWKDPRNSLTFPFWLSCLPTTKVVICLRNPLEVALSLRRRNISSYALSLLLWYVYNERVLRATVPQQRIITHYNAHLRAPEHELRRLLEFVDLPASLEAIERCGVAASVELRHHHLTTGQLLDAEVAPALVELYLQMCAEAGWTEAGTAVTTPVLMPLPGNPSEEGDGLRIGGAEASVPTTDGAADGATALLGEVGRIDRSAMEAEMLRERLEEQRANAEERGVAVEELRIKLEERDATIGDLRAQSRDRIADLEARLARRDAAAEALRARLDRRDATAADRDVALGELRARMAEREGMVKQLRARLERRDATIAEQRLALRELRAELERERRPRRLATEMVVTPLRGLASLYKWMQGRGARWLRSPGRSRDGRPSS